MKCHHIVQRYTNTCIYTWLGSTMEWEGSREIGWGEGRRRVLERRGRGKSREGGGRREGGKEKLRKRKRGRREEREGCVNNECSLEPRPHLVHA